MGIVTGITTGEVSGLTPTTHELRSPKASSDLEVDRWPTSVSPLYKHHSSLHKRCGGWRD